MKNYIVMEYIYRDADNYKAHGQILLTGNLTNDYEEIIKSLLDDGEFFIAEQVGIPTLYSQLWEFSSGQTSADHAYHEFSNFRQADNTEIQAFKLWGTTKDLLDAFLSVRNKWDCTQSINCAYI